MKPLIFLDVDGVLISHRWIAVLPKHLRGGVIRTFDPSAMARLNRLVRETCASVVVSSTWRLMGVGPFRDTMRAQGYTGTILGRTPVLGGSRQRGYEIAAWRIEHRAEERRFVILDDSSDMAHLRHRLVQTNFDTGLLDEHVERAIAMLRRGAAS